MDFEGSQMNKLFWMVSFFSIFLLSGCGSMNVESQLHGHTVSEIVANPTAYVGPALKVTGVLIFTSEGIFLFDNCEAASKIDLSKVIMLKGKSPENSDRFSGGWVTIDGEIVPQNPDKINAYTALTNMKSVFEAPGGFCTNLRFGT